MYFTDCKTPQDIKARFRELVLKFHPDRNPGDPQANAKTAQVIDAYHAALRGAHGTTFVGTDDKVRTYTYNAKREVELAEMIQAAVAIGMVGVTIEVIGSWLWVHGDTKPYKSELKAAGFRWHSKRVSWYYRPAGYSTQYNARMSLGELAYVYGSRVVASDDERQAAVAV